MLGFLTGLYPVGFEGRIHYKIVVRALDLGIIACLKRWYKWRLFELVVAAFESGRGGKSQPAAANAAGNVAPASSTPVSTPVAIAPSAAPLRPSDHPTRAWVPPRLLSHAMRWRLSRWYMDLAFGDFPRIGQRRCLRRPQQPIQCTEGVGRPAEPPQVLCWVSGKGLALTTKKRRRLCSLNGQLMSPRRLRTVE